MRTTALFISLPGVALKAVQKMSEVGSALPDKTTDFYNVCVLWSLLVLLGNLDDSVLNRGLKFDRVHGVCARFNRSLQLI